MIDFTYEIDEAGAIKIYIAGNPIPSIFQPYWPDGTAFGKGEAKAWAEQFIISANDPTALMPGDTPSEPTKPRPIPEPEVIPEV